MAGTLLVTGGARGIGRATVELAAQRGYDVAIGYRQDREAALAAMGAVQASGRQGAVIQADVASEADVVRMFEEAEVALGPITALVNSAGISTHARADAVDGKTLERLMAVNVIGLMLCCREAARRMSTARDGRGGAIVNVGSMAAALGGRPGGSHYAGSKGAVDSFTRGFAREVAKEGIRVNVVRPGVTLTDMVQAVRDDPAKRDAVSATIPLNRPAAAVEIAEPILWLLSEASSFVTGCIVDAAGGGFVIGESTA